jgi:hypothetical protein
MGSCNDTKPYNRQILIDQPKAAHLPVERGQRRMVHHPDVHASPSMPHVSAAGHPPSTRRTQREPIPLRKLGIGVAAPAMPFSASFALPSRGNAGDSVVGRNAPLNPAFHSGTTDYARQRRTLNGKVMHACSYFPSC